MLPWQRNIRQLSYQNPKFALLTCVLPFLETKGLTVLEKKENEKQVSKLCLATFKNSTAIQNSTVPSLKNRT